MTIAVCLLTCDRADYTRRTLSSFLVRNPEAAERFRLLHADDASRSPENLELAAAAGFETVVRHSRRCGNLATRIALIEAAATLAPWIFVLENDCESVRPFPWALFEYISKNKHIYTLRLFGQFKGAGRRDPCKTTNQWTGRRVRWTPLEGAPEPAEVGLVHWTAQPSVTRARSIVALHKGHRKLGLTARVTRNVLNHFGDIRTNPGGADRPAFELEPLSC